MLKTGYTNVVQMYVKGRTSRGRPNKVNVFLLMITTRVRLLETSDLSYLKS